MPRERPLAVGTILQGKYQYQIRRLVGGGGMAWVYQAEKLSSDSDSSANTPSLWALKELRPQTQDPEAQAHARTLFNQEAKILSQLSHPNLPKVIDFFEDGGRAYLVMEFIWGESLEKRIEQARSPLMERQVLTWAVQICEVLEYLHSRQPPIIFRDMKPSNVMVNNAGTVKLVDFGIARTYKEDKLQDTIALGSENYAAPEQWGEAQTDGRSDIYGLGATMYHLLANIPPSPAFLPSEPSPISTLNAALSPDTVQIVTRAMARERRERYQSATEMKEAILACLPQPTTASRPQPQTSAPPSSHNQPTAARFAQGSRTPPAGGTSQPAPSARPALHRQGSESTTATPPQPRKVVRRQVKRVKVCPHCSHRNALASRFCVRCGYSFAGIRPAVLRVVEPVRAAWEMPVHKSPLLLGRTRRQEGHRPDFDMSFYDPEGYVSRRHAHIVRARNGYFIVDLGSSNGTYVNDRLLPPQRPRLLRNGDQITIGEVVIQFLLR
jgi:serine/threonine-protein kinase